MKVPSVVGVYAIYPRRFRAALGYYRWLQRPIDRQPHIGNAFPLRKNPAGKKTFRDPADVGERNAGRYTRRCTRDAMRQHREIRRCGAGKAVSWRGVELCCTEFLADNPGRRETICDLSGDCRRAGSRLQVVIICTLDISGDKPLPGDPHLIGPEANPFLGFRAIRMCLENPEMFKAQLRTILRASAHGRVKLMYPMISCCEELDRANTFLEEARAELRERSQDFNPTMKVGAMIAPQRGARS